jgi:xylulokinase
MSRTLIFDLGSSYFKVCLFDEQLQLVARHSVAVPIQSPLLGRRELPVAGFLGAITGAVNALSSQVGGLRDVTKVSFASQANTFTLLDDCNVPLLPFLVWNDQRADDGESFINDFSTFAEFYTSTGIPQLDRQFMVAKLDWLRWHSPEVLENARRICCISDFFTWWLTGHHLTEAGLMGLTGLIDIHRLEYRDAAINQLDLSTMCLPTIVRAGNDAGQLRKQRIDEWGLAPKCRLAMGCLDQYAGAIGAGVSSEGGICETTGTVLATVRCSSAFVPDPASNIFQGPTFMPGIYFQMVFSNLSAGMLERYRNQLPDCPAFEVLDRLAGAIPSGADGLKFNRLALRDDTAEMFSGRTTAHGRGHEVRAILEAVAYELKSQVSTLCGDDWPHSIKTMGGAAKSQLWLEIKRDILGCTIERVNCAEPTSLGAARLAKWAESN